MDIAYKELEDRTDKHYSVYPCVRNPWYVKSWNCQVIKYSSSLFQENNYLPTHIYLFIK